MGSTAALSFYSQQSITTLQVRASPAPIPPHCIHPAHATFHSSLVSPLFSYLPPCTPPSPGHGQYSFVLRARNIEVQKVPSQINQQASRLKESFMDDWKVNRRQSDTKAWLESLPLW